MATGRRAARLCSAPRIGGSIAGMDDVLPQKVRPASFAYLLPFALAGVTALVWDDLTAASGACALAWVAAVASPLVGATRGASLGTSYAATSALSTLAVVATAAADGSCYVLSSWFHVLLAALMALSAGGIAAGVIELLAWPFKRRIHDALGDGLQRLVPRECLAVVFACTGLFMVVCRDLSAFSEAQFTRALVTLLALMGGATLVSFAWELRLRLRVRAILAGRVPGWRAVELPDDVPRTVPTLRWLDDLGWVSPLFAARHGRDRAILREDAPPTGAYRTGPHTSEPYVVVPPRVSLTCFHTLLCATFFFSFVHVSATFREVQKEFAVTPAAHSLYEPPAQAAPSLPPDALVCRRPFTPAARRPSSPAARRPPPARATPASTR